MYSIVLLDRTPTSTTLFPYTTLFRSRLGHQPAESRADRPRRRRHRVGSAALRRGGGVRAAGVSGRAGRQGVEQRDRKSTRLNSSHGYISYAVFCLKKKRSSTLRGPCW